MAVGGRLVLHRCDFVVLGSLAGSVVVRLAGVRLWFSSSGCGRSWFVESSVFEHGVEGVAAAAGECNQGLVMSFNRPVFGRSRLWMVGP